MKQLERTTKYGELTPLYRRISSLVPVHPICTLCDGFYEFSNCWALIESDRASPNALGRMKGISFVSKSTGKFDPRYSMGGFITICDLLKHGANVNDKISI